MRISPSFSLRPSITFLALLLGLISACEEPIESPVDLLESRLVISSTFAPDRLVTVRLSATQPATGEVQAADIRDATVNLFDGRDLLEQLKYVPDENPANPGSYRTQEFQPLVGRSYTLHVSVDGMTPVSARSSIPLSVPIQDVVISDRSEMVIGSEIAYSYNLHVDYADPALETNYYDLRINQEVIPFRVTDGDTTFYNPILKTVSAPDAPGVDLSTPGGQASVLLQDKPAGGVDLRLRSVINPHQEILGNLVMELRTVSEPYYRFQQEASRRAGGGLGGVSQARVNSYTNVQAGYGVFAGYSVAYRSIPWR